MINEADQKALQALYQKIAQTISEPAFFNWDPIKVVDELRVSKSFVWDFNQQLVSFITFRDAGDVIEIMAVGTEPVYRRQGLLQKLLKGLIQYAAQQNKPLWLEVHEKNSDAIKLYQKSGFTFVQSRKNYYPDGASAWVMTRP